MLFKPQWALPHPKVHLGTASWSNNDWKGPFYPEKMAPRDFLSFYAEKYDTVEVDSTFYRIPSLKMARKWLDDTPQGFKFALKVPRDITHDKVMSDCDEEFGRFSEALEVLQDRAGFAVFQFGYFNKKSVCPTRDAFLGRLDGFFGKHTSPWPAVVEIRNRRWLDSGFFDFLKERNLIYALTAQEWMPKVEDLWGDYGTQLLTGPSAYIRFLGERKRIEKITDTWGELVIDRTAETRTWVSVIEEILDHGPDVWVYYNNHYGGYAPGSIDVFRKAWEESSRGSG